MTQAPVIKRRNAPETKKKILLAAQKLFAERGYARTGLRDIAKAADVTSPLPVKYFKTKAGLFQAALLDAIELNFLLSDYKQDFAKDLVDAILDTRRPITIPAMISLSIGDAEAARVSSEFAREHIIVPMAKWLGAPNGRARATAIIMLSISFVIFNRHIILDDNSPKRNAVSRWLENTVQAIIDGDATVMKSFLKSNSR